MGIIYILADPITGEIRYVGQTINTPAKRLKRHCSPCNLKHINHRTNWIRNLRSKGLRPILSVVEYTDNLNTAEVYWISMLRRFGYNLTNMTNGGNAINGYKHSQQTKDKIRAKLLGKTFSAERCKNISKGKLQKRMHIAIL